MHSSQKDLRDGRGTGRDVTVRDMGTTDWPWRKRKTDSEKREFKLPIGHNVERNKERVKNI